MITLLIALSASALCGFFVAHSTNENEC